MVKLSKSDQDPVKEKEDAEHQEYLRHKLMNQPMTGQQPGDGCTIVHTDGTLHKGVYTEEGWEYAEIQHAD